MVFIAPGGRDPELRRVETEKSCPAPSQSLAVMMGEWSLTKPLLRKKASIPPARASRRRPTAPIVLVLGIQNSREMRNENKKENAETEASIRAEAVIVRAGESGRVLGLPRQRRQREKSHPRSMLKAMGRECSAPIEGSGGGGASCALAYLGRR